MCPTKANGMRAALIDSSYDMSNRNDLIDLPSRRDQLAEPAATPGTKEDSMAKILCVLYDDPVDGYPTTYAPMGCPRFERYPGGQKRCPHPRRPTSPPVTAGQRLG